MPGLSRKATDPRKLHVRHRLATLNIVSKVRPATPPSRTSSIDAANDHSLVVGMTRRAYRCGMHISTETVGSFENVVRFGERSRFEV